jgi:hypothetical protein
MMETIGSEPVTHHPVIKLSLLERGTEIIGAETNSQTAPPAKQRLPAETDGGAKSPHSGAINAKRPTKVSTQRLGGGRDRDRTCDPHLDIRWSSILMDGVVSEPGLEAGTR